MRASEESRTTRSGERDIVWCVRISKMAKKYEAVSPDIRGKITAYKYVLSESLCRATERSSFGNPLRSFATVVVLRVHCAQSFRPACATRTYTHAHTACFFIARDRGEKRGRYKKRDEIVPSRRSIRSSEVQWWNCTRFLRE